MKWFKNEVAEKLFWQKMCSSTIIFNWKKIRKIQKIDFESQILALFDKTAKLGKASEDAYKQRGWLESVCCKKQQKKFLTSYWFVE